MSVSNDCFKLLESLDCREDPVILQNGFNIELLRIEASQVLNVLTGLFEVLINFEACEKQ